MIDAGEALRGKHARETAWIVGLGASIQYLTSRHFGTGPVITMNEAIKVVQELGLSNQLYSLQKDGCHQRGVPGHQCGGKMTYPRTDIPVILPRHGYAEFCLEEHPSRLWLDYVASFGLDPQEMSVRIAVALALRVMGCASIVFVCCDSLIGNDLKNMRRYYPETGEIAIPPNYGNYSHVRPIVLDDVRGVPHHILTPKQGGDDKNNPDVFAPVHQQPLTLNTERADWPAFY